jgi:putative two-component system response regulator
MELASPIKTDLRKIVESLPEGETAHMLHVGILAGRFTQRLIALGVCRKETCKYYGKAAAFHDIGKAWVSESILTKPGRLTEEERTLMLRHPVFAENLFKRIGKDSVSGLPDPLIPIARDAAVYHHERWDGSGYPYGLEQGGIPLVARITAVCDAYDAMTHDRPYRRARSRGEACRELDAGAGTQFDPALVRIFLNLEREFSSAPKAPGGPH